MRWVSMVEQLHTSLRSLGSMLSVGWRGVQLHHWTLEKWNRVLWTDESGFTIQQADGGIWVGWRNPEKRSLLECRFPTVKSGRGG